MELLSSFLAALRSSLSGYWDSHLRNELGPTFLKLLTTAALILMAQVIARIVRPAVRRGLTWADPNLRVLAHRLAQFGVLTVTALLVLAVWGADATAIVAVFGVAGLALSLAFQDVLRNLVAGFYVLLERPFRIGDTIEVKGVGVDASGRVEDIHLRTTLLRTHTGQRVIVPNAALLAHVLTNRSVYGRELARLRISVASTEDLDRVEESVLRTLAECAEAIHEPEPTTLFESVAAEKSTLRVEFWTSDRLRAEAAVTRRLRRALPQAEVAVLE